MLSSLCLIILDPVLKFAALPLPLAFVRVLCIDDPANTMLHSVVPVATVLATIGVCVGALTMLLVVAVVAFVTTTILPYIYSMAVHDTVLERSLEVATVSPLKAPVAAHLVLAPHSRVL